MDKTDIFKYMIWSVEDSLNRLTTKDKDDIANECWRRIDSLDPKMLFDIVLAHYIKNEHVKYNGGDIKESTFIEKLCNDVLSDFFKSNDWILNTKDTKLDCRISTDFYSAIYVDPVDVK